MRIGQDDYYTILNLTIPSSLQDTTTNSETLKTAYRKALLQHHPDRKSTEQTATIFTVDQILQAYETLANPATRLKYDEILLKQGHGQGLAKGVERSAVETFDLEDLQYHETSTGGVWEKSCRCGSTYQVNEKQLEEVASDGEIVVGCRGCSLSIKITFDAVEE